MAELRVVHVPPDKSILIRVLLLRPLAAAPWEVDLGGWRACGDDVWHASVAGNQLENASAGRPLAATAPAELDIDCGGSATLLRLLAGLGATRALRLRLRASGQLRRRPIAPLLELLRALGARRVDASGWAGQGELVVEGDAGARGDVAHAFDPPSAQLKGAALLAGLAREGTTTVREARPTRDHTERMLAAAGARIELEPATADQGARITLRGPCALGPLAGAVPGDPSSAALLSIALLGTAARADPILRERRVRFPNVATSPQRTGFFAVLARMGAHAVVERRAGPFGDAGDIVIGAAPGDGGLVGVDVAAHEVPALLDEVPALVAAACLAQGASRVLGLAALRTKESDRVAASVALAQAFGARAWLEGEHDLLVEGPARPIPTVDVVTHGDHRIAMAALSLGRALGVHVALDEPDCLRKSYPAFESALADLLGWP